MAFRSRFPNTAANKLKFNLDVDVRSVTRLFRELRPALHRRHTRRALEKAGKPLAAAIRKEIRQIDTNDSTGVLGNSIGSVSRTHRTKQTTTLIVGALRKPEREVLTKRTKRLVKRSPTRYFHLSARYRDGAERVQRYFGQYKNEMANIIAFELEKGLMKELARLKQKQHDSK